jgi:hypothetical protein
LNDIYFSPSNSFNNFYNFDNNNLKKPISKINKKDTIKKQPSDAALQLKKLENRQQPLKNSDLTNHQAQNIDSSSELESYTCKKTFSQQDETNKSQKSQENSDNENSKDENFNENDEEYIESDLMKYNDRNFRRKQKQFDEDFVTGTQKKAAPRLAPQAPFKLSYQEKLTQKDLLYEAIFTELYNIKSLEDMQRLEELNKRDVNYSSKKQFSEFIKVKRRIIREDEEGVKDKEVVKEEKVLKPLDVEMVEGDNVKEVSIDEKIEKGLDEARKADEEGRKDKVDIEELIRRKVLEREEESGIIIIFQFFGKLKLLNEYF